MISRVLVGRGRSRGGSQRYLKLKQARRPPVESLDEIRTMVDVERGVRRPLINLSYSALFSLAIDKRICKALFSLV
jgi:hypothetical protein